MKTKNTGGIKHYSLHVETKKGKSAFVWKEGEHMVEKETSKQVLFEAGKELARVVLLAILPVLIISLEKGDVDWRAVGLAGSVALLRAVDKGLHELGKVIDSDMLTKGLTQF